MDDSDRELYLLGKGAEGELRERERALDALSEADKQNPDHPTVRAYHDALTKANAFREAGVTHLLGLYFAANSVQELLDQMQVFGEEVTPKIK